MTVRRNIYGTSGPIADTKGPNTKCAYFDGSSHISFPFNAGHTFGNGKFTIDFWMKMDGSGDIGQQIVNRFDASADQWYIGRYLQLPSSPEGIRAEWNFTEQIKVEAFFDIIDFKWHHVAWVRETGTGTNDVMRIYIDGDSYGTTLCSDQLVGTSGIYIGRMAWGALSFYIGYLTNARIVKGEALWTGSSSFTPPGLYDIYDIDSNTTLYCPFLYDFDDHSSLNLSATNDGVVLVNI